MSVGEGEDSKPNHSADLSGYDALDAVLPLAADELLLANKTLTGLAIDATIDLLGAGANTTTNALLTATNYTLDTIESHARAGIGLGTQAGTAFINSMFDMAKMQVGLLRLVETATSPVAEPPAEETPSFPTPNIAPFRNITHFTDRKYECELLTNYPFQGVEYETFFVRDGSRFYHTGIFRPDKHSPPPIQTVIINQAKSAGMYIYPRLLEELVQLRCLVILQDPVGQGRSSRQATNLQMSHADFQQFMDQDSRLYEDIVKPIQVGKLIRYGASKGGFVGLYQILSGAVPADRFVGASALVDPVFSTRFSRLSLQGRKVKSIVRYVSRGEDEQYAAFGPGDDKTVAAMLDPAKRDRFLASDDHTFTFNLAEIPKFAPVFAKNVHMLPGGPSRLWLRTLCEFSERLHTLGKFPAHMELRLINPTHDTRVNVAATRRFVGAHAENPDDIICFEPEGKHAEDAFGTREMVRAFAETAALSTAELKARPPFQGVNPHTPYPAAIL